MNQGGVTMPTTLRKVMAASLVAFVQTVVSNSSLAQDYAGAPDCCGTPSVVSGGACIPPSTPAPISIGVILVEFTDRTHYTGGTRPNGYLKSDFEDMLFSDNFYVSPPKFNPENESVFGSLKDWYQENSHGLVQIAAQLSMR
jgi:hypothetical protein